MTFNRRLNSAWWALRLGLGLGPFLAGLDKFFNLLVNWEIYLNPLAPRMLHVSPAVFMRTVGVVEMIVGIAILTRWTRRAAYVAMAWLLAIAANLLSTGMFFDLAIRDVEIAIAAYALGRLTEVREEAAEVGAETRARADHSASTRTLVA
jgi:uncharacterized membrane protein YphA (DoxX/SURF4 family)